MKKIFLLITVVCIAFLSVAQKRVIIEEKMIDTTPEIIVNGKQQNQKTVTIRMKNSGDKQEKMTIEIDGNKVKINGKNAGEIENVDVNINENKFLFNNNGKEITINGNPLLSKKLKTITLNNYKGMGNKAILGIGMEKVENGVKITSVSEGSGAEKASLKEDDIITKIDGRNITTEMDITKIVGNAKPGDALKIDFIRNGNQKNVKAILGERKMEAFSFNGNGDFKGDMQMPGMPPLHNFDFKMDGNFDDMDLQGMPLAKSFMFKNTPKLGASLIETEDDKGLEIASVEENSIAAKAGLQKGDIVTKVGDALVKNIGDIKTAINDNKNKTFAIVYIRNGKEMKTEVKFPKKLKTINL